MIPTDKRKAAFRLIDGVRHKYCWQCGIWVPVSGFYQIKSGRRAGQPRAACITCENRQKGSQPTYPTHRVMPFVDELIARLGVMEAARRIGITQSGFYQLRFINRRVKRRTVERILLALQEARGKQEVRHRRSIRHGAAARGRVERVPTRARDYYRQVEEDEEAA